MDRPAILEPGSNCWRVVEARRATVLIDDVACLSALRSALARAQRSIFILGWHVDSMLQLPAHDGPSVRLGDLLAGLTRSRPELDVFILIWDFASLYANAHEWLPIYRANWTTHGRLHFHMDDRHPPGASQHQKLVVVDDEIAFCGGMDLAPPRDPAAPRHDIQLMVQGEPARVLGELARERWLCATGNRPQYRPPAPDQGTTGGAAADFEHIDAGIARTEPAYAGRGAALEIERLYLDAIAAARRSIYIENPYFTAPGVGDALAARLEAPDSPEIVLILPCATDGWLAENEIDIRQARLIERLRSADRHGRLRACCPYRAGEGARQPDVRGKVLIIDDRLLSIGSANLSQRSMRLDSELNVALEARTETARAGILAVRERLLAAHLGGGASARAQAEGLLHIVDASLDSSVGLRAVEARPVPALDELRLAGMEALAEHPVSPERMAAALAPAPAGGRLGARFAVPLGILLLLIGAAAAWRWTPIREWLDIGNLAAQIAIYREHPLALPLVLAGYVVGGLLVAPISVLVIVTVLAFGLGRGIWYSLLGCLLSSAAVYGIGHSLGRNTIRRLAGIRLNRVSRTLARRGILTMVLVRWLPLAPFSIVNLVAGASHIRFGHFMVGSAFGILTDIVFIAVFMQQLKAVLREPGWVSVGIIIALIAFAVSAGIALRAWWRRQTAVVPAAEQVSGRRIRE